MGTSKIIADIVTCILAVLVYYALFWTINASLKENARDREKREAQQRKWASKTARRRP